MRARATARAGACFATTFCLDTPGEGVQYLSLTVSRGRVSGSAESPPVETSRQVGAERFTATLTRRGDHEALGFGRPRSFVYADVRRVSPAAGGRATAGHAGGGPSGAADADADADTDPDGHDAGDDADGHRDDAEHGHGGGAGAAGPDVAGSRRPVEPPPGAARERIPRRAFHPVQAAP